MIKIKATQKITAYLGFAAKARGLVSGAQSCEAAIKKGDAKLIIVDSAASANTKKLFSDMGAYRNIPCYEQEGCQLGKVIGKEGRMAVCITQKQFAQAIINEINLNMGVE